MKKYILALATSAMLFIVFASNPALAATTTAIEQTNYDKIYFGLMIFFLILALFTFRMKTIKKKK